MIKTKAKAPRKTKVILIAVISFIVLYIAGGGIAAILIYNAHFAHIEAAQPGDFSLYLNYNDIDAEKYPRREFSFLSGRKKLAGFEYGEENFKGLIVIAAGRGGTGDDYMAFATHFIDKGYRVITYDKTGTARSEGGNMTGLYQPAADLDALLTLIEDKSEYDDLPIYLLGHSMGGYGICAVMEKPHRVKAAASLAGYNDGLELYTDQGLRMFGLSYYSLAPHFWAIHKWNFGSAMKVTAVRGINSTDIPFLIVQGRNDELVTYDKMSVYLHRNEITNPNTEYILTEGSHEWLYSSEAAMEYQREMDASLSAYLERPDNKAQIEADSDAVKKLSAQWAQSVQFNKHLYNEVDAEIMNRIEMLFENSD
jgi:alpha-beta hydrolase superfamily lysophospholipase